MDKYELLKSVGFSEEYMDHLRRVEEADTYVLEAPIGEYHCQSCDAVNVVVAESLNSFSTKLSTR